MPYVSGGLVALLAVFLYGMLVPGKPPLTQRDVDDTIASALASVTPPPAFSEMVYQAVQPSLVLIQTTLPHGQAAPDATPDEDGGLGSGVVVSQNGDILTSLHVIAGATAIKLTFAEGRHRGAEVVAASPRTTSPSSARPSPRRTSCPPSWAILAPCDRGARPMRWAVRSGCTAR